MKRFLTMVMVFVLALAPLCPASVGVRTDGTQEGSVTDIDFLTGDGSKTGSVYTVYGWSGTGNYRHVDLDILGWQNVSYGNSVVTAASPYYMDIAGGADYIVFVGSGTAVQTTQAGSPIEYTFRVPDDYTSNPTFVISAANTDVDYTSGTPNYIDWDVVVNRSGSAVSTTRYDQTPVALLANTTMQDVTLTYATAADILAGDVVTLRIWRVYEALATSTGRNATADLRVYTAAFRYTVQY